MADAVTIANRALQMCGVGASGRITSLTQNSKNAAAVNVCYETLRRAEIRRNFWGFAIKRQVMRAVQSTDQVLTPATYSAVVTYDARDLIVSGGVFYTSLQDTNLNHTPASSPTFWSIYTGTFTVIEWDDGLVYYAGELVENSGNVFLALSKTTMGVTPAEGDEWHEINAGTLSATPYTAPTFGRTYAYVQPRDFLRIAPQDPKWSDVPPDWLIENGTIISDQPGPILFRYVRDEDDVSKFDPLFLESFAARIAFEVCEELTQSTGKLANIAQARKNAIYDARIANAIEAGPVEPDEDELITVQR